ncbi:SpoIIE family protein phosphatase [Streptomyces luteocolor]|uniref:SpoIIE family protein phosphatase n=1 Tax=Streptomyces luteocolor TaxID=285500 RepID=UPI0009A09E34|nr:SpoIIE family protein phosphatase [Streptomyces luteocolor]
MSPADRGPVSDAGADGAAALLDGAGRVVWWSSAAEELLGWTGAEATSLTAADLLGIARPTEGGPDPARGLPDRRLRVRLRHRSGRSVPADVRVAAAHSSDRVLALAWPRAAADAARRDGDLGRSLLAQNGAGVAEFDRDLRLVRSNAAFDALRPEGAEADWLIAADAEGRSSARAILAGVAEHRSPVIGVDCRVGPADADLTVSLTCFPVDDARGRPVGVAAAVGDVTAWLRANRRLADAYRQAFEIGESLDVVHVARDLVEVLVPGLADMACVDFPDDVLQGRDPVLGYPGAEASRPRRVAVKSVSGTWPVEMVQPGEPIPLPPNDESTVAVGGVRVFDAATGRAAVGDDPHLMARMMPEDMHSALGCPLYHRARLFGYVLAYRTHTPEPYDDADVKLMQDLCDRTAAMLDHAFRFIREHRTALALQQSLLPPAVTTSAAAETSGIYLPASGSVSVGGDWFDALPLSSMRIGLVVGDVIGHGLQATATMARLRTAVQTLADLDLPPDELLTHLDDLVQRMQAESEQPDVLGASCLFAVYDPVTRLCQMASAGHPPPALVRPDGGAEFVDLSPGPPLGVGDNPFEVADVTLPPGSVLALHTDGLVDYDHDVTRGGDELLANLARLCRPERPLEEVGRDMIASHPSHDRPVDDVTLLLARTRAVAESDTVLWEYPVDPAAVHDARTDVTEQLTEWGLEDLKFTSELIVSELVTNAIRYAGGPIGLRLIRGPVLVCEVSDPSYTQPRLRRALITDEGGRGLFLIAQLAARWGCRYGARGKTIWTEQVIAPSPL